MTRRPNSVRDCARPAAGNTLTPGSRSGRRTSDRLEVRLTNGPRPSNDRRPAVIGSLPAQAGLHVGRGVGQGAQVGEEALAIPVGRKPVGERRQQRRGGAAYAGSTAARSGGCGGGGGVHDPVSDPTPRGRSPTPSTVVVTAPGCRRLIGRSEVGR